MALALVTIVPPYILAGMLVAGLALSGVVPVVFSLAGDFSPGRAGAASATVTTIGYSGLLAGPVAIGALAEWQGLRLALGLVVLAGAAIVALGWPLKVPTSAGEPLR
jgi:MFS family permease